MISIRLIINTKPSLTKIYEEADFISLHIPLNKENTNYLNEKFIEVSG